MSALDTVSLTECLQYLSSCRKPSGNDLSINKIAALKQRIEKAVQYNTLCLQMAVTIRRDPQTLSLADIQVWQQKRIRSTHADLFNNPYTAPLVKYLLEQTYANDIQQQLMTDIEKVLPQLLNRMPTELLDTVCLLFELNVTVQAVDLAVYQSCLEQQPVMTEITPEGYALAYRCASIYEVREQQFQSVELLAIKMDEYFTNKMLYTAFKVAKLPAKMVGLGAWVSFIEQAFDAVKQLKKQYPEKGVETVVGIVVARERLINSQLSVQPINSLLPSD